jgi:hypothetical protein
MAEVFMKTSAKPLPFDPYGTAVKLGAISHDSGINWSYVTFSDESAIAIFIGRCQANGHRVRNEHIDKNGNYSVQYHHDAE